MATRAALSARPCSTFPCVYHIQRSCRGPLPLAPSHGHPHPGRRGRSQGQAAQAVDADVATPAYDPLRDGPARLLGYANEVGESFRPLVHVSIVIASYVVAIAYVLVDTLDKYRRARAEAERQLRSLAAVSPATADLLAGLRAVKEALSTLAFQLLASVVLPGYLIHSVVHATAHAISQPHPLYLQLVAQVAGALSMPVQSLLTQLTMWLPTAVGLCVVPLIVRPLDHTVEELLDATLNRSLSRYVAYREARLLPKAA